MNKKERLEKFSHELDLIESPAIRGFTELLLEKCDDYFFTTPASTSGKYHPLFSLGEGGLMRHTRAVVYFLDEIIHSQLFDIDDRQRDLLITGAIAHDIKKLGNDGSMHTVKEHPQYACEFINKVWKDAKKPISEEEKDYICSAVASHMGVWGTPKPETDAEVVLHLADLVASRKEIDVKFISEGAAITESRHSVNEGKKPEKEKKVKPKDYIMPFGKYKGRKLSDIDGENSTYIPWAIENMTNSPDVVEIMKKYISKKK